MIISIYKMISDSWFGTSENREKADRLRIESLSPEAAEAHRIALEALTASGPYSSQYKEAKARADALANKTYTDDEFLEKEKTKLKNSMQAVHDSIIESLKPLEKNYEDAKEAFEKALYEAAFRRIARGVSNLPDLIQDKAIEAFERVKAEATKIVGGAQTEKDEEGKPIPGQSTPLGFLTALYDLGVGAMREEKQKQIEAEAAPGLQAALFGLKAIVGTFNEVYGQKIQMVPSDADKIREKQLDLANERLKDIANQQPVFQ